LQTDHTIKLKVLAEIIEHHLQQDGARPLKIDADGRTLVPNPSNEPRSYDTCDKVVVFSAFPSTNRVLMDVCHLIPPSNYFPLICSYFRFCRYMPLAVSSYMEKSH
jgi:hypothetical protein